MNINGEEYIKKSDVLSAIEDAIDTATHVIAETEAKYGKSYAIKSGAYFAAIDIIKLRVSNMI